MILVDTSAWIEFLRDTGSPACVAVISAPLFNPASTTTRPKLHPLTIRLRMGNVCRSAFTSMENSEITAPFPDAIRRANASFSGGYNFINPLPITATVRPCAASAP